MLKSLLNPTHKGPLVIMAAISLILVLLTPIKRKELVNTSKVFLAGVLDKVDGLDNNNKDFVLLSKGSGVSVLHNREIASKVLKWDIVTISHENFSVYYCTVFDWFRLPYKKNVDRFKLVSINKRKGHE